MKVLISLLKKKVGAQVSETVKSLFRHGWLLNDIIQTFITLISKTHGACKFGQFRPIGLCNFCIKLFQESWWQGLDH